MASDNNRGDFSGQCVTLEIEKSWNGEMVAGSEQAQVFFRVDRQGLEVEVSAPYHNDPAPSSAAGELDGLWNFEVVELFLLGAGGHYLEVELGPHGHYLILLLDGIRKVKKRLKPSRCEISISGKHWQATMRLGRDHLPLPFTHGNAFAIFGQGAGRNYLAAYPVPGAKPDFHQPRSFPALAELAGHDSPLLLRI